ncbi:sugar ABC transporter substrate-binding protein [Nocardioides mesophilus]|uniref:Extracellular solute-binding protein n=1 Tax=Nocardioides mesophilus TaxID=433659 RepID=A0A7G9R9Q5_9ACTN|nr:extracellular solute-binding protein [Nocardioides mesophilus]QNN52330.1 extracellular solute-binding protein [Nocardioides mesophilus]
MKPPTSAVHRPRVRRLAAAAVGTSAAMLLAACGGSGFQDSSGAEQKSDGPITVLIGSSGDAETKAVTEAVKKWSDESGTKAEVRAASDLNQELAQGFAGGEPPDVFYLSTDQLASYASNGSLEPYASDLENADAFFPSLKDAFTYDDQFWCAPKDFSTLALVINTKMWKQAGLSEADIPTTWDELSAVAQKLTKGKQKGLVFSPEYQRVGVFFEQNGGGLVNDEGTEATVNSPENVEALTHVKKMLADGYAAYTTDVGAGWGGEAFGKGLAAMTIEGNWIAGAMENDYPDVDYQVVKLPAGPASEGTLQFTNCWGIASGSDNIKGSVALVEQLTSADQQMAFADAFGVMPSVVEVADEWKSANPEMAAFIESADFAGNLPTQEGAADVIGELNAQLATLKNTEPQQILDGVQKNMEAVVSP